MIATQDLFTAIDGGDQARVEALLTQSPTLASVRDEGGVSAILHALYLGRRDMVPLLIAAGQPLDIFEAAATGQVIQLRMLLAAEPAAAREYTSDGFTALHFVAFFSGDLESAEVLLDAGADICAASQNAMRVQPLHSAVAVHNFPLSRFLVERGADVNAQQEHGYTPLMEAAQHGDAEMVECLLANGADVGMKTDDGRTASDFAREAGYGELGTPGGPHDVAEAGRSGGASGDYGSAQDVHL